MGMRVEGPGSWEEWDDRGKTTENVDNQMAG